MERKLAAIFSADVKGYSLLMAHDEAATIATLTTYRHVRTTLIEQHRGRVVDAPGDNLLAEFPSAVEALSQTLDGGERDYHFLLSMQPRHKTAPLAFGAYSL